jgi:hypothetical protein
MPELSERDSDLLKLAKARFKQAAEASEKQREREREDIRFYNGDQWSAEQKRAREGSNASDGTPVPARPTSVVNKVRGPVSQVVNTDQQNEIDFELVAADDFAELAQQPDETEIELREGLARRILRSSEAEDALDWAFSRAAIAGEGFLGVYTRFVPGKSWDKDVYVRRFYNQFSVTIDPAHEQPDGSDAEWGFIGTDMPWEAYKSEFPKNAQRHENAVLDTSDADFRALGEEEPGWFTISDSDKKTRMCRVVEYFYTVYKKRMLSLLSDGSSVWSKDVPEGTPHRDDYEADVAPDSLPLHVVDERDEPKKTIKWCKLDGAQILSETDWDGPDLPIVKIVGEELHPHDQERRVEGIVRPARGSNEAYNEMFSKLRETLGLAPIAPWQATMEQVEGYLNQYQLSATRAIPILFYNSVNDATGQPLEKPTRTPMGSDVVAIVQSLQIFDEAVQTTTQVPDSRVGKNTDSHLKSGKAILALQQQSETGTSGYSKNKRRSVRYLGQIINNLLYPVYGKRPGRLTKIVTGNNTAQDAVIGQPAPGAMVPPNAKTYTLTEGANFNVVVKVARASATRREEESTIVGNIIGSNPMFMTWFGDLFFKNQDGPGHDEMAKRAKVMLAPPIQQMLAADAQGSQVPPEVQQMLAAKDAQIKHAEAAMQELHGQVQGKMAEIASKEKIAQLEIESKERIAALDREVKLGVAELGAKVDRLELFMQESQLAGARVHEAALSAADAHHEAAMSQMEHDQTLQQGQQQAALTPPAPPDQGAPSQPEPSPPAPTGAPQ